MGTVEEVIERKPLSGYVCGAVQVEPLREPLSGAIKCAVQGGLVGAVKAGPLRNR